MINQDKQRTIRVPVAISGVGLHTGRKCRAIFTPAEENSGIRFVRNDLPGKPVLNATVENVVDVIRGTTLGRGEAKVYTIEHILSALNGLEVDNVLIELDDNEPPVLDGSAKPFVEGLKNSGFVEQSAVRQYFKVASPFDYQSHQTHIRIEPADTFELQVEISYDHPMINSQSFKFRRGDDYESMIAPARTFCFDYEIEALKKSGLAKGGSLDNAIVIGHQGIYNPEASLRFENEFVRHKILDLMGDLMLLGSPIKGKIIAKRCGHGHNIKFLRQLLGTRAGMPAAN